MAILDPGFELTLRPMKYPQFFEHFKESIANNWTVNEISFNTDIADIRDKLSKAEKHVVSRLVAFFATGDTIVGNNLVTVLRKHVNSPEARMYYDRQAFEEALHVQFYLTLLDNYLPDEKDRYEAFAAVHNIPSIKKKADFCYKWMDQCINYDTLETDEQRKQFLMNLITFACAVEGLFFFAAFAYVYYLRSRGLLHGLGSGTNWVFRDESKHMEVAFEIVNVVRKEYPNLWDKDLEEKIITMLSEAIDCEVQFAEDVLSLGIAGMSKDDMVDYLKFTADCRLARLGIDYRFGGKNPFTFMELQDMRSHTNFFERTVAEYQIGVKGKVDFNTDDF